MFPTFCNAVYLSMILLIINIAFYQTGSKKLKSLILNPLLGLMLSYISCSYGYANLAYIFALIGSVALFKGLFRYSKIVIGGGFV